MKGGAIELAMTDKMVVVFPEVSRSVCQPGLKFVLGEVLVVERPHRHIESASIPMQFPKLKESPPRAG